jgi:hypothetical protein
MLWCVGWRKLVVQSVCRFELMDVVLLSWQDSKFRLILIESRIHRLARYYRTTRKLPPNWKYESATAASLVA